MKRLHLISSRMYGPAGAIRNLLLLLFICMAFDSRAEQAQSLFQSANAYYLNKQYDEAVRLYNQVLQKDKDNANAHFNLGNAYFHLKQYPEAVLYYEKARKLDPDNKYVLHNIRLTNNKLFSKIEFSKEFFVTKSVRNFVQSRSSDSWSLAMLALLWTGVIALCIHFFFFGKPFLYKTGITALAASLLMAGFTYHAFQNEHKHPFAIILKDNATLKKTPADDTSAADTVQAGSKAEILDSDKSWYKIRLSGGKTGWIENKVLEKI